MPKHSETRILPYTPLQLFNLVADIETYPKFLPWCTAARILKCEENLLIADLVISFKGFTEKYTSKVKLIPHTSINVEMVEGPFTHLHNLWQFKPTPEGTEVYFEIDFGFRSKLLEKMIGLIFETALAKMVEAFEQRARVVYTQNV
jgi:coenzyme Q-binding protein COQ10